MATAWVYILRCADGSFYTGMSHDPQRRLTEHQQGVVPGYTKRRRPVELVWTQAFGTERDALSAERKIKGWSRAKKEALIRGDYASLHEIVVAERRRRESQKNGTRSR